MKNVIKKNIFFISALLLSYGSNSQSLQPFFNWASESHYSSNNIFLFDVRDIATDPSNNVYTIGTFAGTAVFGTTTLTALGPYDGYITKTDNSGNHVWTKNFSGPGTQYARSIAIDGSGNIYVAGQFYGTAVIGTTTLASQYTDVFICKMDNSGNVIWAVKAGGAEDETVSSIAVDASGNVYFTGTFSDQAFFGSYSVTSVLGSLYNSYVCKMNPSGVTQWVKHLGSSDYVDVTDLAIDGSGNIAVTGKYSMELAFGTTNIITPVDVNYPEVFIAKLNSSGNMLWTERITSYDGVEVFSVAYDAGGNSYVSARVSGMVALGSNTLTGTYQGMLICKLDPSGSFLWNTLIKNGDILVSPILNAPGAIAVDNSGNVLVTGDFSGSIALGNSILIANPNSPTERDVFIAKIDPSGNFIWAKQSNGPLGAEGMAICSDSENSIYFTGSFKGNVVFGSHSLTALNGAFLVQIKEVSTVGLSEFSNNKLIRVYPNPSSGQLILKAEELQSFILSNELGQVVREITLSDENDFTVSLINLSNGIYFLHSTTHKISPEKIIVIR